MNNNLTQILLDQSRQQGAPPMTAEPQQTISANGNDRSVGQMFKDAGIAFLDSFNTGKTIFAPIVYPIQAIVNSTDYQARQAQAAKTIAEADAAALYAKQNAANDARAKAAFAAMQEQNERLLRDTHADKLRMSSAEAMGAEQRARQQELNTNLLQDTYGDKVRSSASAARGAEADADAKEARARQEQFAADYAKDTYGDKVAMSQNQKTLSDMSVEKELDDRAAVNGGMKSLGFLNANKEYAMMKDEDVKKEVTSSPEFALYNAFNEAAVMAPMAIEDLANGNENSHAAKVLRNKFLRVGYDVIRDENGNPWLVKPGTDERYSLDPDNLPKVQQELESQLNSKVHECLASDASFYAGMYNGEAIIAINTELAKMGFAPDQQRAIVGEMQQFTKQDPYYGNLFYARKFMETAIDEFPQLLKPSNMSANPPVLTQRDQSNLATLQEALSNMGFEVTVSPDADAWVIHDQFHKLGNKSEYTVQEFLDASQGHDKFLVQYRNMVDEAMAKREAAEREYNAKMAAYFLKNARGASNGSNGFSFGEDGEGEQPQGDTLEISDEKRQKLMTEAGEVALEWDDSKFAEYDKYREQLVRNAKAAGLMDEEGNLIVSEENADKIMRMAEVEKGMIKKRKLNGVRPIFQEIAEAIKDRKAKDEGLAMWAEEFAKQKRRQQSKPKSLSHSRQMPIGR